MIQKPNTRKAMNQTPILVPFQFPNAGENLRKSKSSGMTKIAKAAHETTAKIDAARIPFILLFTLLRPLRHILSD
jgi:hypothetical protein